MKILHILDHSIPLHSGYTFRTRAILEQQRRLGWETFHVTSPKQIGAKAPVEEVDGFQFYRSKPVEGLPAKLPLLNQWAVADSLAKRLDRIIPEIRPDILHAHSPALNGVAALRAAKKFRLPVVYECRAFWEDAAVDHGTTTEGSLRYRLTRALETHVFRQADAVTAICEGLRLDIIARGIPENKITVIPNAVDIEKFTFNAKADPVLRDELGLTDKIVLGFIGSFYAYEGLPLLLDAMPAILQQAPNVRLLLVGGGPQEEILKQKTENLGLGGHVIFTGRVPHDRVTDYYNQVDIFVYPRLPMRLTELVTPLKPLEAMAQGRLVVASDVGGHKELINRGENGFLFSAGDEQNLTRILIDLIEQRSEWETIKANGRTYVEEERNWAASVGRYSAVYSKLCGY
ncbi:TIGR04063 family PEP-CTERM/XrtA system glycosyltransferase [Candidatus Methylomicrobium oryzae]|uniref:TIGR04063 family PEP-CTERM/XrtA system glycosyltransferase n=1 Tax=Candidatus Methylomicrobium oryzae TaxID=2802053 RepID=UPI001923EC80|nr:TIGR04063 family PEP-CTERM/XrtA system glycosyltransferase [Methylomicrobium sp. RS1]MBL1264976.1 glycosyltransferase, exosortase A system-associated [Methylomicrobium sp. RS1]